MPIVSSVDYTSKRIYLSAATINTSLDVLDVYREVRAMRASNPAHQLYPPMVMAGGNLQKMTGVYTPAYVILAEGVAIVPFDAPHRLRIIRDTFTLDGRAGRDCFDRTGVATNVDIDVDFPEIEIREVTVGGGGVANAPTAAEVASAVRDALATELARLDAAVSSRVSVGALVACDVKKVNGVTIIGSGREGSDEWRRE